MNNTNAKQPEFDSIISTGFISLLADVYFPVSSPPAKGL